MLRLKHFLVYIGVSVLKEISVPLQGIEGFLFCRV